jgi:hypothetical protein
MGQLSDSDRMATIGSHWRAGSLFRSDGHQMEVAARKRIPAGNWSVDVYARGWVFSSEGLREERKRVNRLSGGSKQSAEWELGGSGNANGEEGLARIDNPKEKKENSSTEGGRFISHVQTQQPSQSLSLKETPK